MIVKKSSKTNEIFFAIISGLLILTRGEFILIFILIMTFIFIYKKIKIISLIKILVITLIILSPYLVRNYINFNQIFLVKSLGYNLWKGNNEMSRVEGYENFNDLKFSKLKSELLALEKNKYYEINRDDIFFQHAITNISNEPQKYIKLFIKKFFSYYFIDINSNYPNYYNFFHIFPVFLLSLLSFPGLLIFYKLKKFENKCLNFYFFLNLIIFSIFFILPRYKLAILPIQIILSMYLIQFILKKFKIKKI